MSAAVNRPPRLFHVLEFPDKRRTTLEVLEFDDRFELTMHLCKAGKNLRKEAKLVERWIRRGIAHTRNDPRPNYCRTYLEGELVYSSIERQDRVSAVFWPGPNGGLWG